MASIYDKLAQAKYEEKLKATIITLAKGVYGEGKDRDTEYDVVTGFINTGDKTAMLAWAISYEDTAHGLKRTYLLQSKQCASTEDTYQSLIRGLRILMTGSITVADKNHVRLAELV